MKKALFIDRDGTIIKEPAGTLQVNSLEELEFLPGVIRSLYRIVQSKVYELVMVSNQDGLGTPLYPQRNFDSVQSKMLRILEQEGVVFDDVLIDTSVPSDKSPNRKPGTGMLGKYTGGAYDLAASFVIGDRRTDIELAVKLGCPCIFIPNNESAGGLEKSVALVTGNWDEIASFLQSKRKVVHRRKTRETEILVSLDLDGTGISDISTGIGFFDHMLDQIAKHAGIDLVLKANGDLHIDEHHTIEDTGIALGEAFLKALGDKRGIFRYGFCLPMDDCLARVAVDFGGRAWMEWDAVFKREKIGEMPTEMFFHFFKSFSDAARCNLNIKAEGENEHHKIEAIFKAFARAVRFAVKQDRDDDALPSTKGLL